MPMELIRGSLLKLLYDGFKTAVGRSRKLRTLLEDLKFTLLSLQPRMIQQIGECGAETYPFPSEEILNLQRHMEEGKKLIGELSTVDMWKHHIWYYGCMKPNLSDQLAQMNCSLRRMLYTLKLQEAKDMKELLLVARNIRMRQNDLERRLAEVLKVHQESRDGGMLSGSHAETGAQGKIEGNGAGVQHMDEGDAVRALEQVFCLLLEVLHEVDIQPNGARRSGPVLADLKLTVLSFQPLMEEISDNRVFHLPKEELDNLRKQLKNIELVDKCSKAPQGASYNKHKFSNQVLELDEYLRRLSISLREKVAKDVKETLDSVAHLEMMLTRMEKNSLEQNQTEGVTEPHAF